MYKQILTLLLSTFLCSALYAVPHNKDSVISDKKQSIYWQDTPIPKKKNRKDWDDAASYCDALVLNGLEHWRLPTFNELLSIVDYRHSYPAINPVFSYTAEGTYWTATDFSATRSRAWTIDFRTGKTYYSYKTTNHAVRCVSDFETKTAKDEK